MKDKRDLPPSTFIMTPSIWETSSEAARQCSAPALSELVMEVLLLAFVIALMVGLSIVFPITPAELVDGGYRDGAMENNSNPESHF